MSALAAHGCLSITRAPSSRTAWAERISASATCESISGTPVRSRITQLIQSAALKSVARMVRCVLRVGRACNTRHKVRAV